MLSLFLRRQMEDCCTSQVQRFKHRLPHSYKRRETQLALLKYKNAFYVHLMLEIWYDFLTKKHQTHMPWLNCYPTWTHLSWMSVQFADRSATHPEHRQSICQMFSRRDLRGSRPYINDWTCTNKLTSIGPHLTIGTTTEHQMKLIKQSSQMK